MKWRLSLVIVSLSMVAVPCFAMGYSKDYQDCMKAGVNQPNAINKCQIKEYKQQSKRLKKLYKTTLKYSTSEEKNLINQMQKQWQIQKDVSCGVRNKKIKEMNIANSGCALQMTSARADMLEVQLVNKKIVR